MTAFACDDPVFARTGQLSPEGTPYRDARSVLYRFDSTTLTCVDDRTTVAPLHDRRSLAPAVRRRDAHRPHGVEPPAADRRLLRRHSRRLRPARRLNVFTAPPHC
jgi:hypothetical protein